MPRKQRRFLGELDAESDDLFANHFVESSDLARIHTSKSDIIYGLKGVGKTALRRALAEIHSSSYYATKTINLNQISFAQVYEDLSSLKDASKTEVAILARNVWRNVLAMYCLETISESLVAGDEFRSQIHRLLERESFDDSNSGGRLVGQIERLFLLVGNVGLEDQGSPSPLGLTKKQRNLINNFPTNPLVRVLLEKCSALMKHSGKPALLCLDGFDSIVDHTQESRKAIFAGLIDAVHKCSRDSLFSGSFCFKAFLPQELASSADSIVWDADKFLLNTHHIRWEKADFQLLIRKRLLPYAKTKSAQFADIWHEFMPARLRNETHKVDEASFNYIVRHTLYRPRQVLAHLQAIFDRWDEKSDSFRVDPTFIPHVVARTNYTMARSVVNQLEVTYPGLGDFMQSWSGAPNVMTVGDFQARLKRVFGLQTVQEVNVWFDDLFNLGIFGLARRSTVPKGPSMPQFRFSFIGDRIAPNVHVSVEDSDLLAFSPMLHEFCGCVASEWGAIIPVAA